MAAYLKSAGLLILTYLFITVIVGAGFCFLNSCGGGLLGKMLASVMVFAPSILPFLFLFYVPYSQKLLKDGYTKWPKFLMAAFVLCAANTVAWALVSPFFFRPWGA